jgi:hypothetical protein
MPKALTITRDDYTAAELREAATHSNDADATRRMLALALVLEGYKRGEAGKLDGHVAAIDGAGMPLCLLCEETPTACPLRCAESCGGCARGANT